ncbi:MAG: HAMP domain-containing histidine kinase [Magnetococcales bacterium]|nr:HAMP domain-containing histidine kinase [Magnetococcales bacterium]
MRKIPSLNQMVVIGLFILCVVLISISFFLFRETGRIHQQAMNDHGFLSLLNTVLEVRRYEKNYFIFRDRGAFDNAMSYLDQVERQLREYRNAILSREHGDRIFQGMGKAALEYRESLFSHLNSLEADSKSTQAQEVAIHQLGKKLIGFSEQLAADTEDNLIAILDNTRMSIVFMDLFFIMLMVFYGGLFLRKASSPWRDLRRELERVLDGQQERVEMITPDLEVNHATTMLNKVLEHASQERKEALRRAPLVFSDEVLARLVKALEKPITNISTSCQILMEEFSDGSGEVREMIGSVQQQAEQGSRLLTDIREYVHEQEGVNRGINLKHMLDRILVNLYETRGLSWAWQLEVASDLEVIGNPRMLERGLTDWMMQSLRRNPSSKDESLMARRVGVAEIDAWVHRSVLKPLVWLPANCLEVVELSLPWYEEIQPILEQSDQDVSWLCLPGDEGDAGICLLPGIVRRHHGALLIFERDSEWRFAIWLPSTGGLMR